MDLDLPPNLGLTMQKNRLMIDKAGQVYVRAHELVATCKGCQRSIVLDLVGLIRRRGHEWPRQRIKARCQRCGRQADVAMRPRVPMVEMDPLTRARWTPLKFEARARDMIPGDRVHYWCLGCGDRWTLEQQDFLGHPMGGEDHRLKDATITACGNCGEKSSIAVRLEWVEPPGP